jgi:transposase
MAEPLVPLVPLVSDEFWNQFEPLLPKYTPDPKGGAPRKDDRSCLEGIVHVLRTGTQWQRLPASDRWPSGSTCWRRFTKWTKLGIWMQLHRRLLNELGIAAAVNLQTVIVDSSSVRAKKGAHIAAPTLSIAGKRGVNAISSRR